MKKDMTPAEEFYAAVLIGITEHAMENDTMDKLYMCICSELCLLINLSEKDNMVHLQEAMESLKHALEQGEKSGMNDKVKGVFVA